MDRFSYFLGRIEWDRFDYLRRNEWDCFGFMYAGMRGSLWFPKQGDSYQITQNRFFSFCPLDDRILRKVLPAAFAAAIVEGKAALFALDK